MEPRYYRLNPHLNTGRCASMFDVAAMAGCRLITGNNYGDDYLVAPPCGESRALVEEIMATDGIFFEAVPALPAHLRWHEN